jgi:hypothetical protein
MSDGYFENNVVEEMFVEVKRYITIGNKVVLVA